MQRLIEILAEGCLPEKVFIERYPFCALVFAIDKNSWDSTTSIVLTDIKPEARAQSLFDTLPVDEVSGDTIADCTSEGLRFKLDPPKLEREKASRARAIFLRKSARNEQIGILIGRSFDNDIIIDMPTISKHHAQLLQKNKKWYCSDLGSRNGTLVDGSPVTEDGILLTDNSVITLSYAVSCRFFTPSGLWSYLKYFRGMKSQVLDQFDIEDSLEGELPETYC